MPVREANLVQELRESVAAIRAISRSFLRASTLARAGQEIVRDRPDLVGDVPIGRERGAALDLSRRWFELAEAATQERVQFDALGSTLRETADRAERLLQQAVRFATEAEALERRRDLLRTKGPDPASP